MPEKENNVCKEAVFEKIFMETSTYLRNYLLYKSGNLERSEDLVQDAFSKLWENCKKVSFEKARSFLFKVANNAFLNLVEKDKVRLKTHQSKPLESEFETPEFKMEYDEYKSKLENAINELPDGQKEVFLMNRIDKMTYKDIAAALDISVKAVEKRMSKALQSLKDIIY